MINVDVLIRKYERKIKVQNARKILYKYDPETLKDIDNKIEEYEFIIECLKEYKHS